MNTSVSIHWLLLGRCPNFPAEGAHWNREQWESALPLISCCTLWRTKKRWGLWYCAARSDARKRGEAFDIVLYCLTHEKEMRPLILCCMLWHTKKRWGLWYCAVCSDTQKRGETFHIMLPTLTHETEVRPFISCCILWCMKKRWDLWYCANYSDIQKKWGTIRIPLAPHNPSVTVCGCVQLQVPSPCDVMVCTVGHNPMKKERLDITRNLLDAGIRTEVQYEPLEVRAYRTVPSFFFFLSFFFIHNSLCLDSLLFFFFF